MPKFDWDRRASPHFGLVWVPMARVDLASRNGVFRKFSMQIDTGAIVSLLPRSAADWLGVVFGIGRPIYLGSVGGGTFQARIHYMTMRVGSRPAVTAPFAIAEVDRVPQLLGRVGVLDRFRLILDPRHRRTEFVGPVHRENVD